MKIYTSCSKSHVDLLAISQESEINEPLITRKVCFLDSRGSSGDYSDKQWKKINMEGIAHGVKVIEKNLGKKIGFCDADVVFLKPFILEVDALLDSFDVLFQNERDHLFNPGVSFFKCTENVLMAWCMWHDLAKQWDGHLPHQNILMKLAFSECRVKILPDKYSNSSIREWSKNHSPSDEVLFHANCTPPPESVAQKLKLMKEVWKS